MTYQLILTLTWVETPCLPTTFLFFFSFLTAHIHLDAGTRIGQALIVINVYILPQRTQKPKSAGKNLSVSIWGGGGLKLIPPIDC